MQLFNPTFLLAFALSFLLMAPAAMAIGSYGDSPASESASKASKSGDDGYGQMNLWMALELHHAVKRAASISWEFA